MIAVCFYFESHEANTYSGRDIDLQMWRESLKALGCTDLYVINSSGESITFNDATITLHEVADYPEGNLVFFDPKGGIEIKDFNHPIDPIYVFGRDSSGLALDNLESAVRLPLTNETWAICAANIALYDRMLKL